ncbi:MAG TPA: hypothetical protein VII55_03605, partial [Candidatus Saccharimonadales bacterium]
MPQSNNGIIRNWLNNPVVKNFGKLVKTPVFAKRYAAVSVLVLLATTLFWSIAGANLQLSNADQLANPYLFRDSATFHNALFPGAHSFLIKWPVFLLIKLFGSTDAAFTAFTVGLVVATIGGLVVVLYRIERRPLFFGTLCLALAAVLLLVPAQPYAGGLLPVNMAMVATRNLEYILYIAALVLFIKSPGLRSWKFWTGIGCLGLLIASDRLFLALSVGGALLALIAYALSRRLKLVGLSVNWLVGTMLAGVSAIIVLGLIQAAKVTHISNQAGATPYGTAHGLHDLGLGLIYGIMGLFTNFGANPAYDATIVRNIPHQLYSRLLGVGGFSFAVNALILAFGIYMAWGLIRPTLKLHKSGKEKQLDGSSKLAIMLIWSSAAAAGVFVATNHYYAVDARYLTIALFAVFVSLAASLRKRPGKPARIVLTGAILLIAIALGMVSAGRTF